ncbi:DUF262 domain-containing protein [Cellulosimicrobium sp. NPDC057862]|uniref:GmrSD restriction endonuclease domain-containing protein n=1 Tax=Cellulosimicrobium sp. NPDC057862 TaxID=3346266 RepID=UPI00366F3516
MVSAKETDLEGVLEGKRQYQVPLYQRVYSWGQRQLDQLWRDILQLAADRTQHPSATHFVGSLVLASSPDAGPVGLQRYLVVDGQQRLTTLTLLLAALRDHRVAVEGDHHRARIDDQYLVNRYERDQPTKLLPTQKDRSAYLAAIRATPTAGGEDNVGAAYRFFRSRLSTVADPEDPVDLDRIEEAVLRGLALVVVTAQPGDNAHRIFESLNNTGLRLTQGDLLRNYLFMRLPSRAEAVYESVWVPLQDALPPDRLEFLFWLDLVQRDESAKQSDTYVGQQTRLDRLTSEAEIEAEIRRIARLGSLLAIALEPTREADRDVRRRLERLRAWGTTTVYPVVLQLLARRADATASSSDVAEALRLVESYLVRRVVIGRATANLNRALLGAVSDVAQGEDVVAALKTSLSTGRKHWGTDAQVREAVHSVPFYWQGRKAQQKLVLLWIEESFAGKEMVDPKGLTIEHLLPQSLTTEWRTALDIPLSGTDPEVEAALHTLGNLTLTGYNSELSNRPWAHKRSLLSDSGLAMNRAVASLPAWNLTEIRRRAEALAAQIIELWPGPDEGIVVVDDRERAAGIWRRLGEILAEVPAGRWTTYGDVAALAGTAPVPLGTRLAAGDEPYAYRVLQAGGTVSPGFRWPSGDATVSPRALLETEGVRFDSLGRADAAQRISAAELAMSLGWSDDAGTDGPDLLGSGDAENVSATVEGRPDARRRRGGSRTTLGDLLDAGLIAPGARLYARGGVVVASVGADGLIDLGDRKYESLSAAGIAVAGHAINGWSYWRIDRGTGRVPLSVLRDELTGRGD